jgi:hypothetical protein
MVTTSRINVAKENFFVKEYSHRTCFLYKGDRIGTFMTHCAYSIPCECGCTYVGGNRYTVDNATQTKTLSLKQDLAAKIETGSACVRIGSMYAKNKLGSYRLNQTI